jgi:hypothetical protein
MRLGQKTIGYLASYRGESPKIGDDMGQSGDDMVLQLSFAGASWPGKLQRPFPDRGFQPVGILADGKRVQRLGNKVSS